MISHPRRLDDSSTARLRKFRQAERAFDDDCFRFGRSCPHEVPIFEWVASREFAGRSLVQELKGCGSNIMRLSLEPHPVVA